MEKEIKEKYEKDLYPLMDVILAEIEKLGLPFYLTGGTALHRFYYNYRYSDDLDFFVNNVTDFEALKKNIMLNIGCNYLIKNESRDFLSIIVDEKLKIDFVNDIPFHYGQINSFDKFSKVDNVMNILSNKITSVLSRQAVKDLVDIWVIWKNNKIEWHDIFKSAQSKAAGIYPPEMIKMIDSFPVKLLDTIIFTDDKYRKEMLDDLPKLCQNILL